MMRAFTIWYVCDKVKKNVHKYVIFQGSTALQGDAEHMISEKMQ